MAKILPKGNKPPKSTNEQFQKDLADGQSFEKSLPELLVKYNYGFKEDAVTFTEGKCYWDFDIGGIKFEVKCDSRASDTGNLAFEWEYREKPSGIARDEPDIWVHGVGPQGSDGIYVADAKLVRWNVLNLFYEGKARYMKFLGDGCSGYLVKLDDAIKFMEKIK